MAKEYKAEAGFHIKIKESEKGGDFGPGNVVEYPEGFEVVYPEGCIVVARELPKGQKNISHLKKMGALVELKTSRMEEEGEDEEGADD